MYMGGGAETTEREKNGLTLHSSISAPLAHRSMSFDRTGKWTLHELTMPLIKVAL